MCTDRADGMLQLAAEAFRSKNFELASDIYECQLLHLRDPDPASQLELMVKRADALAFGGNVSEAFAMYRKASEIKRLRPDHLENLIEYLSSSINTREDTDDGRRSQQQYQGAAAAVAAPHCGAYDAFSCRMCYGFLYEPVTLPCGHCFCKKCLDREKSPVRCRECGDRSKLTDVHGYRVNVVLSNLLSKWFPIQLLAARLRREGNRLYSEKRMEAALEKYNEAILIAPRDHVLFSNRSHINIGLMNYEQGLRDAEMACKLMPLWSKGHIKKAQALVTLGKTGEALQEYLVSISLDSKSKLARTEAQKLLGDLLVPVMDRVHDKILDCSSLLSSRTRIKGSIIHPPTSGCITAPPNLSYKERKTVIASRESSEEKLTLPHPYSEPKGTLCPFEKTEHRKVKGEEQEDMNTVCHATVIDRSLFLKRKRNAEDDSGSDGVKRPKSEGSQTEGTTCWSTVLGDLIDPTDLECSLCMRLYYEPVTTPCGHTFCLKCLERCLDHNPKCPLCKEELFEYLAQRQYCKTILMENLICKYLPVERLDRQEVNQEEMAELSNLNKSVPIFVCTMAFPTVPCPLHIFEPCYRLMIRRCMETGTKQFGMCLGDAENGFVDYGCLLEIRNVEFFADGRSVVDTIGRRRFKVVQHSQRDGYNTADIEYLEDDKAEGVEEQELRSLHDVVYDQALVWVNSLRAEQKDRIVGHFGAMPEKDSQPQASPNGPSWCWWLLAVLPLESRAQLPFLALTSLKDRLSGIRRVLLFMARNRQR